MATALKMGFLMDPLEHVRVDHDTTFALMLEAQRQGCEVRCFTQPDLGFRDGSAVAWMRTVQVERRAGDHFRVLAEREAPLAELDVLFLRKDPPVDVTFLHATQMVELGRGPFFINAPAGLRAANEKLFALHFQPYIPRTVVTRHREQLRSFVKEVGGRAVLKPLDGFGGKGVLLARRDDPNLCSLLELVTEQGQVPVMAQAFLPESTQGDKRVLLLDGEPLGAVLRVAGGGDFRCNMAAGGQAKACGLTAREQALCRAVGERLRKEGLIFVGLDLIGEHLTEVNVTSPTGLVELEALGGAGVARRVVELAMARGRR